MKTAYELAMERLATKEPVRNLTEAQKKALAEIDSTYRAKIAERETFLGTKIAAVRATGGGEEAEVLQEELARDLRGIRDEWDQKKEKARNGG
ncbi:MAG: hypothetical protein EB056_04325 [Verrucomicrobia bacterium]|nr:hypothetical protein [Verrucomicrobiota bacterium]